MERDQGKPLQRADKPNFEETALCWMDLLERSFSGWEPVDQMLERVIDSMERDT